MRLRDRWNYLRQAEKLAWDILFRGQYNFAYDLMPVHTPDMPLRKRLNLKGRCESNPSPGTCVELAD